ncbi:hypothetical protein Poli38472_005580 [Pythium oligandrum]|uniref:EF-hand domain-containing protein n=1 Tax=Pythium oligandrum TaxID=41045 RepID=A0A8K1CGJ4_PYTOL|nr:hypothetical protein Poli38472_005580 [Pythium oligandrum]|eukprot:TMW62962.1 hypothetical protein Poli38472_005580 [Pythium oligandrum]
MGTKHSVPRSPDAMGASSSQASSSATHVEMGPSAQQLQAKLSIATVRPHDGSSVAIITPLDMKITNALREFRKKRKTDKKDAQDPFTRIILKFPLVRQAFNSVRSTFDELDRGRRGYIVYADMEEAFVRLGINFSREEMNQVFQESDMQEDGRLTFKEFLVCLAIAFVLHKVPSLERERLSIFYAPMNPKENESSKDRETSGPPSSILFGEGNKLRVAFQMAIDAFLWFDVDGSGHINRDEIASRLNTSSDLHSPTKKTSSNRRDKQKGDSTKSINTEILERRFSEMDWNHDGSIQFKEFLMAFASWVGLDEDEDTDA